MNDTPTHHAPAPGGPPDLLTDEAALMNALMVAALAKGGVKGRVTALMNVALNYQTQAQTALAALTLERNALEEALTLQRVQTADALREATRPLVLPQDAPLGMKDYTDLAERLNARLQRRLEEAARHLGIDLDNDSPTPEPVQQ
ncbi:hypothetical protein F0P96_10465 [Hymenobacter busanensis]|uniref:Uncharacterized protein n=1 Tax=Hymenobacter busanensis TaxID=2607656 RepID=A0A7L4ZY25_9BACT|nr:hypothetical protein [Hymenobacter busanensis]KAA9333383.1 hypothetical protein F0P96_10465 [Hymenobacter busanensis]QHJ07937.1 hypothetical protein GUY19_11840 [Hymenobacter busanensis]